MSLIFCGYFFTFNFLILAQNTSDYGGIQDYADVLFFIKVYTIQNVENITTKKL